MNQNSLIDPLRLPVIVSFAGHRDILDTEISDNFEKNLVAGVIEVMTVFTARMHGKRSHKNKKLCAL